MDTQLKKGVLELCVLAILAKKTMYGYELVSNISKTIQITEGTIYPLLRRLKQEGFVTTFLQESNEGPSRKYYEITKTGEKELAKLRHEWDTFHKKINSYLQKI